MNESVVNHRLNIWKEALVSALAGTAANSTGSPSGVVNKAIDIAENVLAAYDSKAEELQQE